jgi:hypothetical protein
MGAVNWITVRFKSGSHRQTLFVIFIISRFAADFFSKKKNAARIKRQYFDAGMRTGACALRACGGRSIHAPWIDPATASAGAGQRRIHGGCTRMTVESPHGFTSVLVLIEWLYRRLPIPGAGVILPAGRFCT